jgi:hypothetical protein
LWFVSCRNNPYRVDISSVKVDLKVERLEQDLFLSDPSELPQDLHVLIGKYKVFMQLFGSVINAGEISDSSFNDILISFCTDRLNNEVFSAVNEQYADISWLEEELEEAFRYYRYYFPDKNLPEIYTCITGFNASMITLKDSIIGIGLDRYLGWNSEYYKMLGIYRYVAARMNSYNIIPDCFYAWGKTVWDFKEMEYPEENILTDMIHEGKLKYFERCMLPDLSDTLLFGFTDDQMQFCSNNEGQMWRYLVEQDLLFSSDQMTRRKLTGEAPFTSYFTNESPGRAAVWLGFRIIESYMRNNREITLGELMNEKDIQGLLGKARYNPK